MKGANDFADSVAAQIEFENGSVAQLIYTGEGDPSYPKEVVTVNGAGLILECENFLQLRVHRDRKVTKHRYGSKGHAEEMAAWLGWLRGTQPHPQSYADARRSMLLTFAVLESLHTRSVVRLSA